eukprot:COSAG05_NODE_937_length_6525_cov_6.136632_8_plen_451_part_00
MGAWPRLRRSLPMLVQMSSLHALLLLVLTFTTMVYCDMSSKRDVVVCGSESTPSGSMSWGDTRLGLQLDGRGSLINITACSADGRAQGFIPLGAPASSLWQLNTTDCMSNFSATPAKYATFPGGVRADGSSSAQQVTRVVLSAGELLLEWNGVSLPPGGSAEPTATVNVSLNLTMVKTGQLAMRVAVDRSMNGICIQALALPNLPLLHLRSPELDTMFLPQFFGHLGDAWGGTKGPDCGGGNCDLDQARDNFFVVGEGDWMPNGGNRNMQWGALFSTATRGPRPLGFYLGSHDPLARVQNFDAQGRYPTAAAAGVVGGGPDGGIPAGFRWVHLNDNLRENSTAHWELDYPVVLAAVDGDWWDAAQIHREWAVAEAIWTANGTTAQRAARGAVPTWFLDTPLWVEGTSAGSTVGYWCTVLQKTLGLADLGVFWPFWNTEEFDSCCAWQARL